MEITKREIIASITIIAIMTIVGVLISGEITEHQNDKNVEYQKAVHITDTELFRYGMETNIGNAFVYGELNAVDTVTFDEIGGHYLYVKKVKERYERHERTVTKKDKDGKEYKKKEIYYTWDVESQESRRSKEIEFCGIVFPYSKIGTPRPNYIKTIHTGREWSWRSGEMVKVRFKYYGISPNQVGTLYTCLNDNEISDDSRFYQNYSIDQALDSCTSGFGVFVFWIAWILLTIGCAIGFCVLDNYWLED